MSRFDVVVVPPVATGTLEIQLTDGYTFRSALVRTVGWTDRSFEDAVLHLANDILRGFLEQRDQIYRVPAWRQGDELELVRDVLDVVDVLAAVAG